MSFVVTGFLTVGLVYLLNKIIATPSNSVRIVFIIPLIEEAAKTGLAALVASPILLNHAFFGASEAIFDMWQNKKKVNFLGWIAFIGHLIFGFFSIYGYTKLGSVWVGIVFGYFPHVLWNLLVIKIGK